MASIEDAQRPAGRSWSNRSSKNPQQQLTTIEKSVTHLLVATKQLLETLTKWSRGAATETEVSDVYVRLGYEFNIACRAFNAINVDTTDLGPVPELLRKILEDTLSQDANQQSLDRYLPEIRDIIIKLLHGLKKKQQRLRQKAGSGTGEGSVPTRQGSMVSSTSLENHQDELPTRTSSSRSQAAAAQMLSEEMDLPPPRTSSVQHRGSPQRESELHRSRDTIASDSSQSLQNIPVIAPYPEQDYMPLGNEIEQHTPVELDADSLRPPTHQNDALTALQKGGDLERRASRRFSAYQIQKHLGTSMNGMSAIPPAQHSPIPNRGRDVRESMSAVKSRRSVMHNRSRNRADVAAYDSTPSSLHNEVRRISEEPPSLEQRPSDPPLDSPTVKTPPDKIAGYPFPQAQQDTLTATLNGPMSEAFDPSDTIRQDYASVEPKQSLRRHHADRERIQTPPPTIILQDTSPQAGKELTLFLQYKSKIKKFVLSDGGNLTMARLQLAFIEKFAWNTQNNGVDLPEIYIQDPVSGVRHELEDLGDVKERSVLVLNVEALDEVKRHFDDGLGGLRRVVEGIKSSLDQQHDTIQLVSERQQESAKELAGLATSRVDIIPPSTTVSRSLSVKDKAGQLREVQSLKRELAIVRQTYKSFVSDINASMSTIRTKAASVKTAAETAMIPSMDGNTGRTYVNKGKKTLSDDSEKIVNRVDDLQDIVEDLRKDVVQRGVRPLTRQLEDVSKNISTATTDLKKLQEYLKHEKPIWTKIWEKELQVVCDDRDLLTMQEDLAADLEDDLEKAAATFALVEEATKAQNLQNTQEGTTGTRTPSRTVLKALAEDSGANPEQVRDGVLGEVRALQPNHESRLEAIERAEKLRQRELEQRLEGTFKKELKTFQLKKSGGFEEVERVRLIKDEMARRENHATKTKREVERRERRQAEAAAAVTEPASRTDAGNLDLQVPTNDNTARDSSPDPPFVEAQEGVDIPHAQ